MKSRIHIIQDFRCGVVWTTAEVRGKILGRQGEPEVLMVREWKKVNKRQTNDGHMQVSWVHHQVVGLDVSMAKSVLVNDRNPGHLVFRNFLHRAG